MKYLALPILLSIFLPQTAAASPVDRFGGPEGVVQTIHHCGYLPTTGGRYTRARVTTHLVETKLAGLGYRARVDGQYGRFDKRAVRQFQSDYGLRVDGVVGPETAQRLAYISHPSAHVRRCERLARGY